MLADPQTRCKAEESDTSVKQVSPEQPLELTRKELAAWKEVILASTNHSQSEPAPRSGRECPPATRRRRMPAPVVNLDAVVFDDIEDNGLYTSRRALFSAGIGARKLGYNLTELPPGKSQCPFHAHREEEEMFLILDGEGELRFGNQRLPLRARDVVACPAGGPEVAHQIINTGNTILRYLAVSTMSSTEVCEYPDSGKVGVFAGSGAGGLRKLFRAGAAVPYYDGESLEAPGAGTAGDTQV